MTTEASTAPSPTDSGNDFDAAKAVFERLKGIPLDRQERILRWVCESLGIALPKYIERPSDAPPPVDPTVPPPPPAQPPLTDIKTFIASKNPKSDQQFAAAVAYYYRFVARPEERRDTISAESLQEASRQARGGALHAPNATLNNAVKSGLLDRGEPGEFRLNTVGENLVAMTLPGDGNQKVARAKPKRKRAVTTVKKKQ